MAWNPYYDEWAALQQDVGTRWGRAERQELRGRMIRKYAFAIPGEDALACIARYAPIVEMGAGNGYWTRCLRDRGVDVIAYDQIGDQWRAYFRGSRFWTEVMRGGPERLGDHPDRTLLLCWPDPWSGMDEASLRAHRGERVVYVGELGNRGPGTEGFRRLLRDGWREVERVALPQWDECEDLLAVYERTTAPPASTRVGVDDVQRDV